MNYVVKEHVRPHAVFVPYPAQGHVNPLLKLAKLLHYKNFHITFVNTEYSHRRLLNSRGEDSLDGLPDFQFEAISDGLPLSDDVNRDIPTLCESMCKHSVAPFRDLLLKLRSSHSSPPVTCIISDGVMSFTIDPAEELGIPTVFFWTPSSCGVLGYSQFHILVEKGLTPLKDVSYLTNGYLETTIDWIPGIKNLRLKDIPAFIRTTVGNDVMVNFMIREINRTARASAVIINTFDAFEKNVLDVLSTLFPPIYTIGPLHLLVDQIPKNRDLENIVSNLWKEQPECIEWLDTKNPNSVLYVNFGSVATLTPHQLIELAWGLANSKKQFLWIIRTGVVDGGNAELPDDFVSETKARVMLASWCRQEKILKHPAVGGFLSHMGWNSTLESMCAGVPMICLPLGTEQPTNCRFACNEWGVGLEIDSNVKRDEVEKLVRELMDGEKGKQMKRKAMDWKSKAEEATRPGGSSHNNLDEIVKFLLKSKN